MSHMKIYCLAIVALAGCPGDDAPAVDAPPPTCNDSKDCDSTEWCNPSSKSCDMRASNLEFDRDVYPQFESLCVGCHMPGGIGAKDATNSGVMAIFDGGPESTHSVLITGGTTCESSTHRLCIDEPRNSLMIQRLLPENPEHAAFVFPDGYDDSWMQIAMQWIAAGAVRAP